MARPGVDGRTSLARSSQWLTEIGENMRKSWPSSYFEAKLKPYLQFRIWASFPGSEFRNVFLSWNYGKDEGYWPLIVEISISLIFHDPNPSQFHFEIMRKAEGFNYHSKMTFWSFKIRHLRHLNLQKSKNSTYWQTNTSIQDWGVQITESSIR